MGRKRWKRRVAEFERARGWLDGHVEGLAGPGNDLLPAQSVMITPVHACQ